MMFLELCRYVNYEEWSKTLISFGNQRSTEKTQTKNDQAFTPDFWQFPKSMKPPAKRPAASADVAAASDEGPLVIKMSETHESNGWSQAEFRNAVRRWATSTNPNLTV